MLNFYSAEKYFTYEEKIQIFVLCNKFYKFLPVDSLKLINQLIKSMNSMNYKIIEQEVINILKIHINEISDNIYTNISSVESKVMNFYDPPKLQLDQIMEKYLKQTVDLTVKVSFMCRFP